MNPSAGVSPTSIGHFFKMERERPQLRVGSLLKPKWVGSAPLRENLYLCLWIA